MLPPSNLPSEESLIPGGLISRMNGLTGERSGLGKWSAWRDIIARTWHS